MSAIRRLKTSLRSTMSQNRLNGLAAMYIHKEINLDIDTVLHKFARKHRRRLELINILDTDKDDKFHPYNSFMQQSHYWVRSAPGAGLNCYKSEFVISDRY